METYGFTQLHLDDIATASEHFIKYDNFMSLMPGLDGSFDYCKQFCILGSSFVSLTFSRSGWGYETQNEIDGFLITLPHSGFVQWRAYKGKHSVERNALALTDQREVFDCVYAPGTKYTTVYLSNIDIHKLLTLVLGTPPKTRIFFHTNSGAAWQIQFVQRLTESIINLSANSSSPIHCIGNSLKETLIGFFLYNFPNNFTQAILSPHRTLTPTPHSINKAADYMASNADPHLTVGEVAAFAGLSVRSLQMGFRHFKKTTPIAFLRQQRLLKAQCLLEADDTVCSPKEVASLCGFYNYQTFCKYYLREFGKRPSAFSALCKAKLD
ncbi:MULTISPECIES: helix-turn-helix domain-containing protein [Pseudomonas]|uniref:AraC family transcriptional regulator n=1 Tax=Pseudomonas azadiae TaxID=2843612 RepID=A0ABS6P4X5_9PSED|nr:MULTISPECIES: AraC family transcriptional regulator [Pseudomonas]MBV4455493.1 AraC family transcriptional regulator [Pseudomonas azadiae]NMF39719.1 helix-turn-helix transcriptional regulator [Pseudomonas sp. SWRI 103]